MATGNKMFGVAPAGSRVRVHVCYSDRHFNPQQQKAETAWFSCAQIAAHTCKAFEDAGFELSYGDDVPSEPIDVLWTNRVVGRSRNIRRMVYFASVAHFGFIRDAMWSRASHLRGREDLGSYSRTAIFNYNKTLLMSDRIVLIGNKPILESFTSHLPAVSDRLLLMDCGVDSDHFAPVEEVERRPDFLHAATHLSFRKGTDLAVAAWPDVASRLPNARLVLLGRPGDFALPKQFIERKDVVMVGAFDGGDKSYAARLSGCRWAVLPSVAEGQAGTLLEAMSCGCVPICTPNAGVDAERYGGVSIPSHSMESVRNSMLLAAAEWKPSFPDHVRTATGYHHSWDTFRANLRDALIGVLDSHPAADKSTTAILRSLKYAVMEQCAERHS